MDAVKNLKTISKKDPDFLRYLLGTFSQTERALPMQSLNVSTDGELVTFQILPVNEIPMISTWIKWVQLLKLRNLILVVLPIYLIFVKNILYNNKMNLALAGLSALGAIFLLIAMNLRNDFRDHLSGLDRIHPDSGSRAIQKGWIAAFQTKKLSNIFGAIGVLFGLPAVIQSPELLAVIGVMALIAIFGASAYRMGLKYRLWTELAVFLLLGPILTLGYELAIKVPVDSESIFLGVITGWFAVFIIHLRNFQTIMINNQVGFVNTMSRLGFERSKKLLSLWWVAFVILLDTYHVLYSSTFWMWIELGVSLVLSVVLLQTLQDLKSPVGSSFKRLIEKCRNLTFFIIGVWLFENFTYLVVLQFSA